MHRRTVQKRSSRKTVCYHIAQIPLYMFSLILFLGSEIYLINWMKLVYSKTCFTTKEHTNMHVLHTVGVIEKNPLGYIHKAVKFWSHFQYDIFVQAYLHFYLYSTHRNSKIFRFANYLFHFFHFNSLWFFKMFSLHCRINLIPINCTR